MNINRNKNIKIFKYIIPVTDRFELELSACAEVLCIQVQNGVPCLWAFHDAKASVSRRAFYVIGTGHPMPVKAGMYIGTFQLEDGKLVFHVFEEKV